MMIFHFGFLAAGGEKNAGRAGRLCRSALLLLLMLSGCAEKGPILLNVAYLEPESKAGAATQLSVGVSPFKDVRGQAPEVLGKRTIPSGQKNDFVVKGTVAEVATSLVKKAIVARGLLVKDAPPWDLSAEGMRAEGAVVLIGGEIKTLWLESTPVSMNTHVEASVQIKVFVGDPAEKKIIRTIDVSSRLEQDMLYSQDKLEDGLSEALSSAIDQIFKDEVLKKRLQ